MNTFSYIYDYIPTTSLATPVQVEERNEALDFMDGYAGMKLRDEISSRVVRAANECDMECVIAFIPSWSKERTFQRYSSLAIHLFERTGVEAYLDALSLLKDGDPILKKKDLIVNSHRVSGRKVILIGGIYISGYTFSDACARLMAAGAKSVSGLYVAKIPESEIEHLRLPE